MKHYKINKSDIKTCSEKGIVACWSNDFNCPVVVKNEETKALFDGYDVVNIEVQE